MENIDWGEGPGDLGRTSHEFGRFPFGEVPCQLDILPESNRQVLVLGDVFACGELNHRQGDNPFGFEGTCGLVSCEGVLRQFGIDVSEAQVVRHAIAHGLCQVSGRPEMCGGTSELGQVQVLADAGLPSHAEAGVSLSDLSLWVEEGRGIIVELNSGELWDDSAAYDSGQANHAVVVVGAAISPDSGQVMGFYINDSGRGFPGDSGRFVAADLMQRAWADVGGRAVVTDYTRAA